MSAAPEIPSALLTETQLVLAQLSGFALGVAKALPTMSDVAEPLAKRADEVANQLRNHAVRAIIKEQAAGGIQ